MSEHLIINGDCRRIPVDLSRVDAVVTDPPYGIRYVLGTGDRRTGEGHMGRRNGGMTIFGDDRSIDPSPWLSVPCWFWGADHMAGCLPVGGSWIAWDKAHRGGPKDSFVDCEFAWTSVPKIKRNILRYQWKGVACDKEIGSYSPRYHPTQKPVILMRQCIQLMDLSPSSLILDPYMGSGSTLIAALAEGHQAIGIEIDPRYCEVARRRIERPHARVPRPGRADEVHPLFDRA